jgi:hypothetical protein
VAVVFMVGVAILTAIVILAGRLAGVGVIYAAGVVAMYNDRADCTQESLNGTPPRRDPGCRCSRLQPPNGPRRGGHVSGCPKPADSPLCEVVH